MEREQVIIHKTVNQWRKFQKHEHTVYGEPVYIVWSYEFKPKDKTLTKTERTANI